MEYLTVSKLRDLLDAHAIWPDKSLGQHFLVDGNIVRLILKWADEAPCAVEVGAGPGPMTLPLASCYQNVLAVEIDQRMAPVLKALLAPYPNVRLLFQDARMINWQAALKDYPTPLVWFGNLPYNAAAPILQQILQSGVEWVSGIFMLQYEVARRLVSKPGSKNYGILTLIVGYFADSQILHRVKPTSFYPQPEVDSALIRLEPRRDRCEVSFDSFVKVVKAAFHVRRKTIRNSMKNATDLGLSSEEVEALLSRAGVDPQVRAETLDREAFSRLGEALEAFSER